MQNMGARVFTKQLQCSSVFLFSNEPFSPFHMEAFVLSASSREVTCCTEISLGMVFSRSDLFNGASVSFRGWLQSSEHGLRIDVYWVGCLNHVRRLVTWAAPLSLSLPRSPFSLCWTQKDGGPGSRGYGSVYSCVCFPKLLSKGVIKR